MKLYTPKYVSLVCHSKLSALCRNLESFIEKSIGSPSTSVALTLKEILPPARTYCSSIGLIFGT
jgi:hypothetical protein